MKRYIQYLTDLGTKDVDPEEPHIIDNFGGYWHCLGEWNAPGEGDGPNRAVVNTFFYYYDTLVMSRIADTLGQVRDARMYSALSDTIKLEFNRKFFNRETSLYGTEETYQTYQLLALLGDLVPDGYRADVLKALVRDINERDGHLNTGMIGTKYLWPLLAREGYGDLAFEAATKTSYPSYGHWLEHGATTLLENWTMGWSHNHQYFGSIVEYFYKYLAGIQSPMEGNTAIGYTSIRLEPHVPSGLQSANATLETVIGTIASGWVKEDGAFVYKVSVPANATATVVLPMFDLENVRVLEGGAGIWEDGRYVGGVSGILDAEAGVERISVRVGSGDYEFRVSGDARGPRPSAR
jgi:alpha-L-rhamnosidase